MYPQTNAHQPDVRSASAAGRLKYVHQRPKTSSSPPPATPSSPGESPWLAIACCTATVEASTDSPRTISVNSPNRSATCSGYHGVLLPDPSAQTGPASSAA